MSDGVAIAAIGAIPSTIAAIAAIVGSRGTRSIKHELVTGNNKTVGEMVTEVHGKDSLQNTDFETHFPEDRGLDRGR